MRSRLVAALAAVWPLRAAVASPTGLLRGAGEADHAFLLEETLYEQSPVRRLATDDICSTDWEHYFTDQVLQYLCPCAENVVHRLHSHYPATTNDHTHRHKACSTTTRTTTRTTTLFNSSAASTGPTTTTKTRSSTTTTTTTYCHQCEKKADTTTSVTITVTGTTTSTTKTTTTTLPTTVTTTTLTTTTKTTTAATTTTVTTTQYDPDKAALNTTTSTITSTTMTATSTTITTTVLQPCLICPSYHHLCKDGDCRHRDDTIGSGTCRTLYHFQSKQFDPMCEHVEAPQPEDSCVSFSSIQLSCPFANSIPDQPIVFDEGAWPQIKCRVCGIAHLPLDGSNYMDWWSGRISWGPNQFEGSISETVIHSYKLYVVDSRFQKLGAAVAMKEAIPWNNLQVHCCDLETYSVDIDVELPPNSTYFMVVPVTLAGLELNVGTLSEVIQDLGNRRMVKAGARRDVPLVSLLLLLMLQMGCLLSSPKL